MSAVGDRVWAIAQTKVGDAYVFGAAGPNTFDCSGLTQYCWKIATNGQVVLVHHAATQFHNVPAVPGGWASAIAGDLVFFNYGNDCPPNCPGHVAIAQGDGTHLISATNPGTGVEYTTLVGLGGIGQVLGVGRPLDGPQGGGGGGGGHQRGPVGLPLPLSPQLDKVHWRRNLDALETWSYDVEQLAKHIGHLDFGAGKAFDEHQYRHAIATVQDYIQTAAAAIGVQSPLLYTPFDPGKWKRNAQLLTDFSATLGATAPGPPGGGSGPTFGIDRMANQSCNLTGLNFIVLRRGIGLRGDSDSWAATNYAAAIGAGMEVIFYLALERGGGVAMADFLIAQVETIVGAGNAKHFGLAGDWEPWPYITPEAEVRAFLARLQARGCKAGLYTFWYFQPGGFPYAMGQDWNWVSYVVHPTTPPPGPYDIWQYDVTTRFGSLTDLDRSEMNLTDLHARIAV